MTTPRVTEILPANTTHGAATPPTCPECSGPVFLCESCPHGFGEYLCDNADAPEYGSHVLVLR